MTNRLKLLAAALALTGAAPVWAADDSATQASPPGCVTAKSTPAEKKAASDRANTAMRAMDPNAPATPPATFGRDFQMLASENVFGNLWSRCGLSRRDRSLVTLGILIALRAENELRHHFPIAIRNGLTRSELEEVIYQATGYAGFPAASSARAVAEKSLPAK